MTRSCVALVLVLGGLPLLPTPARLTAAEKLYVANSLGTDIHVIDTATNTVLKRVEVGPQPHGLVATAKGDRLFITIENTASDTGELLWFDPATDTVTRRMTVGPRPNEPACTPDGKIVYVPCDDASWWVIDAAKGTVLKKIATGGRPHNTLCSADGKRMFLGPKGSYHVLIADATAHKLIGEIPLSDAPRPIVLSKDEKRLYANVDTLIGFEVADIGKRKVIHRVEADVPAELLRKASRSHGIGIRPDQKELWMCDVYHDRTYVFDLTADPPKQTETIVMKGGGYWMCFSPDGRRCYISERIGDSVAVIDTATKKTVARVAVGKAPKRVLVVAPPAPVATSLPPGIKLEEQPADPNAAKVVLVAGSNFFKPGEHDYVAGCAVLADLLRQSPGVAPVLALDWPKDPRTFAGAKAVVFFFDGGDKHGVLKGDRVAEVQKLVDAGVGLVQLHQAADYPKDFADRGRSWAGGAWEKGTGARAHWVSGFKSFPDHPIFRGVAPFTINDGWLYQNRFVDGRKGVTPLLRTVNPKGKARAADDAAIVAWAYDRPGKGRSVTFTGGHLHASFAEEGYRRFLVNGILWSAGLEVPADGAPVVLDPTEPQKGDKKHEPVSKEKLLGTWAGPKGVPITLEFTEKKVAVTVVSTADGMRKSKTLQWDYEIDPKTYWITLEPLPHGLGGIGGAKMNADGTLTVTIARSPPAIPKTLEKLTFTRLKPKDAKK